MMVVAALGLLALLGVAVGVRLLGPFRLGGGARLVAWALLLSVVAAVAWFPLSWYLPIDLDRVGLWPVQHWVNFTAMAVLGVLGLAAATREVVLAGDWARARFRRREAGPAEASRRQALARGLSAGALVGAGLVGLGGFAGARRRAAVVRVVVPVAGLHEGLRGLRVVQISDLHAGHTVGRGYVEAIAEAADALGGDLVAVTGDQTDGSVRDLEGVLEPLAGVRSRHGTFVVTGNHDYYQGDAEAWVDEWRRLGMTVLLNERRVLDHDGARLLVAGVADYSAGDYLPAHRHDPAGALEGAPEADLRLLLAHQPRTVHEAAGLGVDLQLSGHTHGGQIFPMHGVALLRQPFLAGLHRVDRTWIYVSRGTGYWGPPLRLLAPSEITLLTLVRA